MDFLDVDPNKLVAIAAGFFVLLLAVCAIALARRDSLGEVEGEAEAVARLKAAVEVALATRRHIQTQREMLQERLDDPDGKLSMLARDDVRTTLQDLSKRLDAATSRMTGK